MATDGARIYFDQEAGGRPTLHQISTTGGETIPIPTSLKAAWILSISPDLSELLVKEGDDMHGDAPLWEVPLPGGTARRVDDVLAHAATWSPDGKQIAYIKGHALYVIASRGGESRKLADLPGIGEWLRWSPDGKVLRFMQSDPEADVASIEEVSADGTHAHALSMGISNPPQEGQGDWTRDGKYFFFNAFSKGIDIWARRERGGFFHMSDHSVTHLSSGPIWMNQPVISPDGKKIFALGMQHRGEFSRWDFKKGQFAPYLADLSAKYLSFSRDGEWIVYSAYPQFKLWRSKADGSERLQLTDSPQFDAAVEPCWSPDRKTIAFVGSPLGKPIKIYLVSPEGGNTQELLPNDQGEAEPTWSPDGGSLAFGGLTRALGESSGGLAIRVFDLKTRQVSKIPGSEGLYFPRWSPDGRHLLALDAQSKKPRLFEFKTQRWAPLANVFADWPTWSYDGRYIYFVNRAAGEMAIERIRVGEHKVEKVASLKGFREDVGGFGAWFGLTPDDSPLLVRNAGTYDLYALDVDFP
jgi:Tol biopolymer transport system component